MKYRLSDLRTKDVTLTQEALECDFSVLILVGSNNLMQKTFSSIIKSKCQADNSVQADTGLLEEFGISSNQVSVSNILDFETFKTNSAIQSLSGKWYCSVDLSTLSKKQLDWIKEYIKQPTKNGVLIITSTSYPDYKDWLRNKVALASPNVAIYEMSYPTRDQLMEVSYQMFSERKAAPDSAALELFIAKMSREYDKYNEMIAKICASVIPEDYFESTDIPYRITYDSMADAMRDVQNFVLDDFIEAIMKPMSDTKPTGKRQVWKILGYLLEDMGPRKLVARVLSKIEELIQFRMAINTGYIPVAVPGFSVKEAKELLGEESPLYTKTDYTFRRLSNIAGMTSLADLLCIRLMLKNVDLYNEMSYTRALYSMVARSTLNSSRLNNDIGVENVILGELNILDSVPYLEKSDLGTEVYTEEHNEQSNAY